MAVLLITAACGNEMPRTPPPTRSTSGASSRYQIEAYMAGEQMSGAAIAPSPQSLLDGVLRDASVPLGKR